MALKPPEPNPELRPKLVALALLKVTLTANAEHDGVAETAKFKVGLRQVVIRQTGTIRRQVQLHVEIKPDGSNAHAPYLGMVVAMAEVDFSKAGGDDEMDKLAAWFSTNPLVGMTRTYIDLITAVGPFNRLMMSPVMQTAIVEGAQVLEVAGAEPRPLYKAEAAEKVTAT